MKRAKMTNEVFRSRAKAEDNCMVSALGEGMFTNARGEKSDMGQARSEPSRLAFGALINLRRRAFKMSLEDLAKEADVELEELFKIEQDLGYVPEPRTVFQIGTRLKLPIPPLLLLSGNATTRDEKLNGAALKFAARSKAVEKLSPEQNEALKEFVKVLADQVTESKEESR